MFRTRELSAFIVVLLTAYFGYRYTGSYVITGLLISIFDNIAYYTPDVIVLIRQKRKEHQENRLQIIFQYWLDHILYKVQSASLLYTILMVLFAPTFQYYLIGVSISFVLANCYYYFRIRYHENITIQQKVSERCARYIPSELSATIWALVSGNIAMWLTGWSYFIASLVIARVDNLMYYGVMIIREITKSKKHNWSYDLKLFWKDLRNLLIEFGPAELIQTFVIYPLFLTYIPSLFTNYSFGVAVGMITANIFFYVAVIPVYERRKTLEAKRLKVQNEQ